MTPLRRLSLLMLLAAVVGWANVATALPIFTVEVTPDDPISSSDPIAIFVRITTPNQPAFLSQPTLVDISGSFILIEVFLDWGLLTAIGSLEEVVELGPLPAGEYTYRIDVRHPGFPPVVSGGGFLTVPEPSLLLLTAWGMAAFATACRNRDQHRGLFFTTIMRLCIPR